MPDQLEYLIDRLDVEFATAMRWRRRFLLLLTISIASAGAAIVAIALLTLGGPA